MAKSVAIYGGGFKPPTKGHFEVTFEPVPTPILATKTEQLPRQIELYQNYPNPFNPTTTISYQLPFRGQVTLTVFDLAGRKISELVNQNQPAGTHRVKFAGNGLAS